MNTFIYILTGFIIFRIWLVFSHAYTLLKLIRDILDYRIKTHNFIEFPNKINEPYIRKCFSIANPKIENIVDLTKWRLRDFYDVRDIELMLYGETINISHEI